MKQTIWQGTADVDVEDGRQEQAMRVVEDADGRLMTEFDETGNAEWIADYQRKFRDMQPAISDGLKARLIANNLIEA